MEFAFSKPIVILPIISTVILIGIILTFLIKAKKSSLLYSFITFLFMLFLWIFGQVIQYIAGNSLTEWISHVIIYSGVSFIALAWIIFILNYTNSEVKKNIKYLLPLILISVVTWIGLLTNNYHHLYFKVIYYDPRKYINMDLQYGILFLIITVSSLLYILGSCVFLFIHIKKQNQKSTMQSIILLVMLLSPLILIILSCITGHIFFTISRFLIFPYMIDFTPNIFVLLFLFVTITSFKYKFLNILPRSLHKIVETVDEGILVVDNSNNIVNYNPSLQTLFKNYIDVNINDNLSKVVEVLKNNALCTADSERIHDIIEQGSDTNADGEICLALPQMKHLKIKTYPVKQRNKYYGRIITFDDITEPKKLLEEVESQNKKLVSINEQLAKHLAVSEELSISKERNRVARELHDTLGHTLILTFMLMKASKIECEKDAQAAKAKLEEGMVIAENGIKELRRTINGLMSDEIKSGNIIYCVEKLVEDTRTTGIKIELTIMGQELLKNIVSSIEMYKVTDTVYKICKESLTNALNHGKATKIDIILKFSEEKIRLFIVDNGKGCHNIQEGFGLKGMKERLTTLNGTIRYGSDGEHGFNIHVEIPFGVNE
jgi:signal transduction histidine kinase